MLHAGPLIAEGTIDVALEPGASAALDRVAASADPAHSFMRAAWFAAEAEALSTLVARRGGLGAPIAALPLIRRSRAGLSIAEISGPYWPYRCPPIAADASEDELAELLASPKAHAALGRAWRIGPALGDSQALARISAAAKRAGWAMVERRSGICFKVDLARLAGEGPWPSSKTLRKNRWLERRLAEAGALEFRTVSGGDWDNGVIDCLAQIEAESWVAKSIAGSDTKFLAAQTRRTWERALEDPQLAQQLSASILSVGGVAAAFTFSLRAGATMHFIANSYSERFADRSPGRILLYRDLQQAAADGVVTVGWGAGDPGYKREMGAEPGPEIVDRLFVRGALLAALARAVWR